MGSRGRHLPRRRDVRLFYVAVVAAWLAGADLVLIASVRGRSDGPWGGAGGWMFLLLIGALLAAAGWGDLVNRRDMARLLARHSETLALVATLAEASMATLPVDRLLDDLAGRLPGVLGADTVAILVAGPDTPHELELRASRGLGPVAAGSLRVAAGRGFPGRIAAARTALTADDVEASDLVRGMTGHMASAAGCPIAVGARFFGVCVVGTDEPRVFAQEDLELLQVVADRAGAGLETSRMAEAERTSTLEVEHARGHLTLLARAVEMLSTAVDDYEPSLAGLVDVVVPDFADWCAVDLATADGGLHRLAIRHGPGRGADPTAGAAAPAAELTAELTAQVPQWAAMAALVVADGRAQLRWDPPQIGVSETDGDDPAGRSCLVTPIRTRDVTVGIITCVTDPARRGYRPSDLALAEDLAQRAAVVVERVLLYRDLHDAAQASARTTAQLRQLMDASLDLQSPRSGAAVLAVVAESAQRTFRGDMAVVTAEDSPGAGRRAVARPGTPTVLAPLDDPSVAVDLPAALDPPGVPAQEGGWLAAPLPGRSGREHVAVAVATSHGKAATIEDQAVLVLLTQMAAAALDSAGLYEAVQSREVRWRALIEATPAGIVEVDLAGNILMWNRSATTMFAWPQDDQSADRAPSFPPDVVTPLAALWVRATERREPVSAELTTGTPPGARYLSVSAAPLLSPGGDVQALLTLALDVTEQKRLEQGMREAQRVEAIGQVAGGVAHDFNNLLTVIGGYSDLLLRRSDLDGSIREMVSGISDAAGRASELTGQLLMVSRRQAANPVVVAPNAALRSLAQVLDRILGVDISLDWSIDADAGNVLIDAGQFDQVVLNLAVNGRDAMPAGGRLGISTRRVPGVAGATTGHEDRVGITVSDTGVGMDEQTRRRCFEPFFTTKDRARGTGLGLAAVDGIVTEAGGTITVTSRAGEGTRFDILLPSSGGRPSEAAVGPPTASPGGTETVLVVEDQADVRGLVSKVLQRDGYRVLTADGGPAALEVAGQWDGVIDLVVCDVVMPDMRGPEVVAALTRARPGMAALLVSGYTDGTRVPVVTGGATGFLAKPFKPSALTAKVRQILDQRDLRARSGTRPHAPS